MKTLKFLTIIAFTLLGCVAGIKAQNAPSSNDDDRNIFQIGIKGGFNNSDINYSLGGGQNFEPTPIYGPVGGVFFSIPFGTFLGIQPEVLYSQKGYASQGNGDGGYYDVTDRLNFIDVPIMLQLKLCPNFYLLGGPEYSYLISSSTTFTNGTTSETTQQSFQNDNLLHNIYGLIFGIDINMGAFTLGGRAAWDVKVNNGNGNSYVPPYRNYWGQVTLGYRF